MSTKMGAECVGISENEMAVKRATPNEGRVVKNTYGAKRWKQGKTGLLL